MDMLDLGMILIPGKIKQDISRFPHTTQSSIQFKTYELFPGIIFVPQLRVGN
jgi:hypothetical protein